jgi:D-glycero-D-manno-heptose 1,7-bisphosphate phosphatase
MTVKQIVFLVGGRGTRLGSLTQTTPKPLLPVGGRPLLDCLIDNALRFGFRKILLLAGYLGETMAAHYENWQGRDGLTLDWVIEPEAAGTGGALKHAADHLDDTFVLCNGDTFFDIDLNDLALIPAPAHTIARMALHRVADGSRYGGVELHDTQITGFGAQGKAGPALINGGIYLLHRSILDWITAHPCSLEANVFPRLVADGLLAGRVYDGFFIDIGIPQDLARAQILIPPAIRRHRMRKDSS